MSNVTCNVTSADIIQYISYEAGITFAESKRIYKAIIKYMVMGFIEDKVSKIPNFGTFLVRHKKERMGRNVAKNVFATVTERNVIKFIPSTEFKYKYREIKNDKNI